MPDAYRKDRCFLWPRPLLADSRPREGDELRQREYETLVRSLDSIVWEGICCLAGCLGPISSARIPAGSTGRTLGPAE